MWLSRLFRRAPKPDAENCDEDERDPDLDRAHQTLREIKDRELRILKLEEQVMLRGRDSR